MMDQFKYSSKWEKIDNSTPSLRVPGGWIVHLASIDAIHISVSTADKVAFVPDMGHTWILEDE